MVRAVGLRRSGRRLDFWQFHVQLTILCKLFAQMYLCHQQYNLVPVRGKVTVGLASHWPRVTDFCGLSTHVLTA